MTRKIVPADSQELWKLLQLRLITQRRKGRVDATQTRLLRTSFMLQSWIQIVTTTIIFRMPLSFLRSFHGRRTLFRTIWCSNKGCWSALHNPIIDERASPSAYHNSSFGPLLDSPSTALSEAHCSLRICILMAHIKHWKLRNQLGLSLAPRSPAYPTDTPVSTSPRETAHLRFRDIQVLQKILKK